MVYLWFFLIFLHYQFDTKIPSPISNETSLLNIKHSYSTEYQALETLHLPLHHIPIFLLNILFGS